VNFHQGLSPGFYQVHGDDNQGATVVTAGNGKTYWLMPYQGHNRLYEITGWNDWQRQAGDILLRSEAVVPPAGTGLTARYYRGSKLVFETTEDPIYYERFGAERHSPKLTPHYKVEWTGFVSPPFTDRYRFSSLLGKGEQLAVWIDGRVVHASGFQQRDNFNHSVNLTAGHPHHIRIEYINPDGRAELKLLWSSRILDTSRLPASSLHPESN